MSGKERPVVGLKLGFASAIATGKGVRFVLAQWNMLSRLRKIPDTVEEFVGFHLQNDLISGTLFGVGQGDQYTPVGSARVRNIILPPESSHLGIILIEGLGKNDQTRAWINSYVPSNKPVEPPPALEGETRNILFAAEVWFNIKKHWCLETEALDSSSRNTGKKVVSSMLGKFNIFQKTMLQWNEMHPYSAVHVVRIPEPLDLTRLNQLIDRELEQLGLTGLVIDKRRGTFEYRGGSLHNELKVLEGDPNSVLQREIEEQLNASFPDDGPLHPFRFFVMKEEDAFRLGLVYFHVIAGAESIILLLKRFTSKYLGQDLPSLSAPLDLYPSGPGTFLSRHPEYLLKRLSTLPSSMGDLRQIVQTSLSGRDGSNQWGHFVFFGFRRVSDASQDEQTLGRYVE